MFTLQVAATNKHQLAAANKELGVLKAALEKRERELAEAKTAAMELISVQKEELICYN